MPTARGRHRAIATRPRQAKAAPRPQRCRLLAARPPPRPRHGPSPWRAGNGRRRRPCSRRRPCARATVPPAARPPISRTRGREDPRMTFKRASLRYGDTPAPVTPYQRAAQVWDDRIGSARVQAHNWRLVALSSLALALLLGLILSWFARSGAATPYIVEVDAQGSARAV